MLSRRTVLRSSTALAAGLSSLTAGCLGKDETEDDELVAMGGTDGTAALAMLQGIATVVNEESDDLQLNVQPGGSLINIGRLEQGETDIAYTSNWALSRLNRGLDPFEEFEGFMPYQLFHYYDVSWIPITAHEWETMSDIEPSSTISPGPSGVMSVEMMPYAYDYVLDDYEISPVEFDEQGTALSEGLVDVACGMLINSVVEPGWLEQNRAETDLRMLTWSEESVQELEEDPDFEVYELETDFLEGWSWTPNPVQAITTPYVGLVRPDLDAYDAIYELLEQFWENRKEISEYHAMLGEFEEDDWWVDDTFDFVPFHPAAADFYQEKGLWSDDFTVEK